ncbi:lysylphosphatidylglycerol synthase transmembrane domain-containing protein [Halocatena salina]|uniref:Flippase-like domain-containing protein n=1 Tax=Halocatena salina TaxID=2934340 RepID=A0A8U0A038_9EURY|nr:lysylphosphatidylglycerol synthase transmembrane domain-containing protein [Halocatena salina]UPM42425.1 flippase-like domain-containing protein [Halocatena salina]
MNRIVRFWADIVSDHGVWLTALGSLVVFFVLFLFGDANAVVMALLDVDLSAVSGMLGLVVVGYGVRFLKWEYYLRTLGIEISIRDSALVFFSGLMLVVTPGKVGELWKAWFLRDLKGVSVGRTVPAVGAERITDLLALSSFAALAVLLYQRSVVVLVGIVVVVLGGLLLLQWRWLCLKALSWCQRLPVVGSYVTELTTLYERTYALFRPRPLGIAMGLSLLAWGLEGLAFWVLLEGFGVSADPILGLSVFGLGSIVGAVSFLPGGVGATETSMVGTLIAVGYDRPVAVGSTVLVRVGTLWFGAFVGGIVFTTYRLWTERRTDTDPKPSPNPNTTHPDDPSDRNE